jgi:hypothetical protein
MKQPLKTTTWPCPGSPGCSSRGSCCVQHTFNSSGSSSCPLASPHGYVITCYLYPLFVVSPERMGGCACAMAHARTHLHHSFSALGRHGTHHAVFVHTRLVVGTQPSVLRLARISTSFFNFGPLFRNPSTLEAMIESFSSVTSE